ncbi:MAG: ribosome biogenesis GTPase YlqF [Clostridiales bacterium]|nr:ribosome biogenesis GTPase YlqF [Clostridiales bacterium]
MDIQWYPGHMTKTRRMMEENISLVDIVCELVDARLPLSSKNPDIDKLAANKKRIIILNKSDLADPSKTKLWQEYFKEKGFYVITADSKKGEGIKEFYPACRLLMKEKIERLKARGRIMVPSRVMIAGIPNVGKSTLINKILGRNMTKVGDKPGVTRSKQWVKIKKDLELLDTPGILWPKFDDKEAGLRLAFTGAVNDDILDMPELAAEFISRIIKLYPGCLEKRYSVSEEGTPNDILLNIGKNRGFLTKGGEVDPLRTSAVLFDEFRGGRLGRITLEAPPKM